MASIRNGNVVLDRCAVANPHATSKDWALLVKQESQKHSFQPQPVMDAASRRLSCDFCIYRDSVAGTFPTVTDGITLDIFRTQHEAKTVSRIRMYSAFVETSKEIGYINYQVILSGESIRSDYPDLYVRSVATLHSNHHRVPGRRQYRGLQRLGERNMELWLRCSQPAHLCGAGRVWGGSSTVDCMLSF